MMAGLFSKIIPSIISNRRVLAFLIAVFGIFIGCGPDSPSRTKTASEHIKSGNAFLNFGLFEAAQKEFEQAKKIDPLSEPAQMGLFKAELLGPIEKHDYSYKAGIFEKRIRSFLSEHPNDPHALIGLGQRYFFDDQETAQRYLNQAIAQNDSIAAAYYVKGSIYAYQDSFDQAFEMYEKALELLPDSIAQNGQLNKYYRAKKYEQVKEYKEYKEAIEISDSLFKSDTLFLSDLHTYSNIYRVQDNLSSALFAQERLIKLLEDTSVISLGKNRGPWLVPIDYNVVLLNNYQKKLYAYYNIALTYYMMALKYDMPKYLNEAGKYAPKLIAADDAAVEKIVNFDIEKLLKEQKKDGSEHKKLHQQLEDFRKKFKILPPLWPQCVHKNEGGEWRIRLSTHLLREKAHEFKENFKQKHQVLMSELGLNEECIKVDRVKAGVYCVQLGPFDKNQATRVYDKLKAQCKETQLIEPVKKRSENLNNCHVL